MFRTPLCDLLGIDVPILQSGMGNVAAPDLVAAVSQAGGLGIAGGLGLSRDDLRNRIRQVRQLTDRPFGVNMWLHTALRPPADVAGIPEAAIGAVQGALNGMRRDLGLAPSAGRPAPVPDYINEAFEVILEERVPVWSIGLGDPGPEMVKRCRERKIKVIAMVATVEDGRAVARSGVDAIVAQGGEAGGHRSTWIKRGDREEAAIGTLALVPQLVDAVSVPIIAAGGIVDGRGLVAALALGASGVLLGTRFVATRESKAPAMYKDALLRSGADATTLSDSFTGLYARVLRNRYTTDYAASGAPVLPPLVQSNAAEDIKAKAVETNNPDYYALYAGQGVGLIDDLPGAGDVVQSIMREASAVLGRLASDTGPK
ncbi:MAG: nitronate monooxygenase family protein [Alphaproteobacteria bacterium]